MFVVPVQEPCVVVAETKVTPAGSSSTTLTPVAAAGPLFVTSMRYERFSPTATGSGESVVLVARLAESGLAMMKPPVRGALELTARRRDVEDESAERRRGVGRPR